MSGRKKTELTEEQKQQIKELIEQGMGIDKISKEVHIHFSKVKEFIDSLSIQSSVKLGRPKSNKQKKSKFVVEHKICKAGLSQPMPIIPIEYDLTVNSYEEDMEFAMKLKDVLGNNCVIEVHKEIFLGGTYHRRFNKDTEEYELEPHKVDIWLPESKWIIIPGNKSDLFVSKLGNKLAPRAILSSDKYFDFLCANVNHYHYICTPDVSRVKNIIRKSIS